jgi:hypothetical protein
MLTYATKYGAQTICRRRVTILLRNIATNAKRSLLVGATTVLCAKFVFCAKTTIAFCWAAVPDLQTRYYLSINAALAINIPSII